MELILRSQAGRRMGGILLLMFALSGCGTTVTTKVSELKPLKVVGPGTELPATTSELKKWAGTDSERLALAAAALLKPTKGEANAISAAWFAWSSLQRSGVKPADWLTNPKTSETLHVYNSAVAIFVNSHAEAILQGRNETIPTEFGPLTVTMVLTPSPRVRAGYYDRLLVASQIEVRGFRERVTLEGIGVPLVAIRSRTAEREEEMAHLPECGVVAPLTCLVEFSESTRNARLTLLSPLEKDRVKIGGSSVPLAADFTAALAFSFGGSNDLLLGIRNLFNVDIGLRDGGIYLTEPLDPDRIPVLLIHGMSSSPIVWRNVVNAAMKDPLIRKKFQFWYAYYSTGAPIMFSASQIREDIGKLRRSLPPSRATKNLVAVGYSMGGVIAQILVTDIGDHLWNRIAAVPFEQVKFDPDDVSYLRKSLFWKPVPHLNQVIFIATPHKGTKMADASFARLASGLIRLPSDFIRFQQRALAALGDAFREDKGGRAQVTGLNGLSAESPLYQALAEAPFDEGVTLHSIIGDRGRGDSPDSSDGIVGYWSSHLDGAVSELIVPTGHDAQASPLAEAEIQRILHLDAREK